MKNDCERRSQILYFKFSEILLKYKQLTVSSNVRFKNIYRLLIISKINSSKTIIYFVILTYYK